MAILLVTRWFGVSVLFTAVSDLERLFLFSMLKVCSVFLFRGGGGEEFFDRVHH